MLHILEGDDHSDAVTVVVVYHSAGMIFNLTRNVKLGHVKAAWCLENGRVAESVKLYYNGTLVGDLETPGSLRMRGGDVIEVGEHGHDALHPIALRD